MTFKKISCVCTAFLMACCSLVAYAQDAPLSDSVLQQMQILAREKASRTPAQRKINSNLLLEIKRQRGEPVTKNADLPNLRTGIETDRNGTVLVDIQAEVSPDLLSEIESLDGEIINSFPQYNAIRARLPLTAIEDLAASPAVRSIRPADRAITSKVNTSQGDVAHKANVARSSLSVNGAGIKVGVLSDSVDALSSLQGSGDLPSVTVLSGESGNPGSSEGTAMLEIVYDLAPGAQLYFATAFNGEASFAQNILDLRNVYGCDVIVDDVGYFDESPFQDGIIAQAVNSVTADGALYFSSAGNAGNKNDGTSGVWQGDYSPTTLPTVIGDYGQWDSVNSFNGQYYNTITKVGFGYALFWSDPLGASSNDYDLFLLNSKGTAIVASSEGFQNGSQDPFEFISAISSDLNNRLVVAKFSGNNRFLHLDTIRGRLSANTDGQTKGHSAAEDAFSVAAVDVAKASGGAFTGGAANPVETFSSDGPRRMFYKPDGTPYTPGNYSSTGGTVRQKPDIAAADGVSTATPGFDPFYGTSAAAPHAAAIAALLLDADPSLTSANFAGILNSNADDVRALFAATALDIEASGTDRDSGYGIIMADRLVNAVSCTHSFSDVLCTYWAYSNIEKIVAAGITGGCGNGKYCPLSLVTRAQMAIFLLRGIHGGSYIPPSPTGTVFSDVPTSAFAAAWIEKLAADGITGGCGQNIYCPNNPVTRAQMAVFLLRSKYGASYFPPAASGTVFNDVPANAFAAAWIEKLAADGISGGCGGGNYCPNNSVRRDEMAVFLSRTFGL
ncbi:MAG: S-layer homology domain-containing protein [Gammaproteobacteria bacterium]|nr:S-layer homology domain-containing protein [Gammaproteobacteria bacterium]